MLIKMLKRLKWVVIYLTLMALGGAAVYGDTWAPAKPWSCESANKIYRLRVIPRDIEKVYDYWKKRYGDEEERFEDALKETPGCFGIVEKKDASGAYTTLWKIKLINSVMPLSALVSNNGEYIVTFDEYHSVGQSPVVIYKKGVLFKQYSLPDFLSNEEWKRLPRSVSSTWWGGKHSLDKEEKYIVLQVVKKENTSDDEGDEDEEEDKTEYFPVYIELSSGIISRK